MSAYDETWEAASHEHFDSAKARWDHDVVVKGTDRSVWSGWTDEADQTALDRCNLASAAPELLRALELVLSEVGHHLYAGEAPLENARAAIAKARLRL